MCSQIVNELFLLYQRIDICAKKKKPKNKTQKCSWINCSNRNNFCLPLCTIEIWLSLSTAVKALENASCMSELYPERGSESLRPWFLEASNTQNVLSLSRGLGTSQPWPFGWFNTQGQYQRKLFHSSGMYKYCFRVHWWKELLMPEHLHAKNLGSLLKWAFKCRCSRKGDSLPGQQSLYGELDPGCSRFHTHFPTIFQRSSAKKGAEKLRPGVSLTLLLMAGNFS